MRFYAALHLLNTYLLDKANVQLRLDAADHEKRKLAMAKCPELRDAPRQYRNLKDLSENVRYNPDFAFTANLREKSKKYLAKIVAIVDPKIKKT